MTFLLLNQTFHPDVVSTAQHLTDLAVRLVERGHDVTVVTSRRAYDHPEGKFPAQELWRGIRIHRVASTGFGKGAKWRRAADFASFTLLCALRLARLPRHDAVVALTSPPLISFLGAWLARLRRSRFYYWVMDFNPDEAIAAGWLRANSPAARLLDAMSRFSLKRATSIIALDRFMRERILTKGAAPDSIAVIPPWSHDSDVKFDPQGRERFRQAHGLAGKFVVMYSGNHSPCHPLDTLLAAARNLAGDPSVVFCFIGGGSEFRKVQQMAASQYPVSSIQYPVAPHGTRNTQHAPHPNLLCLPYQPLSQLSASLSAADLQVVVMGNPFVGLVHPCKIYNIFNVAAPVIYIGPRPSHLSEILDSANGALCCASVAHGEVDRLVREIRRLRDESTRRNRQVPAQICALFSKETLLPKLITTLESA